MAEKFISMRNLKFMLYEVLDAEDLCKYPYFADHSREIFDMVLDTGMKMAKDLLMPACAEMDREGPEFDNGVVKVHPSVRQLMKEMGEGGWISAHAPYEMGGQQIPNTIMNAFRCIFSAANYSASVYPSATTGAAHLIMSFASEQLQETYLENMLAGKWQGTMALTEPQAGTSLTDISTTGSPTDDGYYLMKGQKIFISAAEHDGVDNVVNLVLARIKDAPLGIKGISLFVVPKLRPDGKGGLESNDLNCTGIYHKLGYRGTPITQLAFGEEGDCRGWLVGEAHKGLRYMFQMMNEARLDVGMAAAAISSAAYYASLEYCKERPQGRKIMEKDPATPQIPIISHADVKRMLLLQKSVVEGSFGLNLYCAKLVDELHMLEGEEKEHLELLLDILTPVAKSYPSEMGIISCSQGLQTLGGYGYCDEFPLEQYYRDVRIHAIHEGTTGVQGMDLLGRKVVMKEGKAFGIYLEEVGKTIKEAKGSDGLKAQAAILEAAIEDLKSVTGALTGLALKGQIEMFLADATLFLEYFGIMTIGWQWLIQAIAAEKALMGSPSDFDKNFYLGKLQTLKYFYCYEMPKIEGLSKSLKESGGVTVDMKTEYFDD